METELTLSDILFAPSVSTKATTLCKRVSAVERE